MLQIIQDIIFKEILKELGFTEERISENNLELLSEPEEFDALYNVLKAGLLRKRFSIDNIRKILLCVDECFSNAVTWGNKNVRRKKVIVKYYICRELCAVYVEDQGTGFDSTSVMKSINSCDNNTLNTRGLFFINKYMEKTYVSKKGNKVMIIKYNSTTQDKLAD